MRALLTALNTAMSAALLTACSATAPVNPPIQQADAAYGYRTHRLVTPSPSRVNDPRTLVMLAFSGGGLRAAALSYGVLEELRRLRITIEGVAHPALDQVDMITGVSGGSFTALAYALHGERLFQDYDSRFLKRDIQGELLARTLSPASWSKLASDRYGRSELAADYYDDVLFGGATYADLEARDTPMALVTGTDLSTGARFEFTQDYFDLICSDLGKVRLSRAAATSSAVPVVFTPVTFRNYGGTCGAKLPAWVEDVAEQDDLDRPAGRSLRRSRDIQALEDSQRRPYLHIVDGGVSDNLGLRGMLEALEEIEASPKFRAAIESARLRRIVVIAVNSRSAPSTDWDRSPTPPGLLAELLQSSSVPIDHFSYESAELLKDIAHRWQQARKLKIAQARLAGMSRQQAEASVPLLSFDTINISFDEIADEAERSYFMNLPTSLRLTPEAVDRLRALGGRLLRESPKARALLKEVDGTEVVGQLPAAPAAGAAPAH